ncbi:MAG TPA: Os1348 family NHLP clan protein [Candidatus Limnocylindria bacterium]|jgi:hypothetical protein
MSKEAVAKVIQRAIGDGAFRRQLSTDPTKALRGFDLSPAEMAAIRSGDSGRLSAFGVDLRMSKAFTLVGSDSGSNVSNVVSSDLGTGNTSVLTSGDGTTGAGALISGDGATGSGALVTGGGSMGDSALISGDGATGSGALIGGAGSMGDSALISGDISDSDPMIASGNELGREGVIIPGDPAHALGAETGSDGGTALPDEADQYNLQFHSAVPSDDGASGASMPGEGSEGPEIQP